MGRDMAPIDLIATLTSLLDEAGIPYCHWKSNAALDRVEQGETDLDLLVARDRFSDFASVLGRLGFSPASRPHVEDAPGVEHYFGYDPGADRFVHIHAHYRLVIGHDRTKNHHLPIEDAYLASVVRRGVFPVPAPEFEYVVLVIRMILKYAIADEIAWGLLRREKPGPSRSERSELESLGAEIDRDRVKAIVEEHLPFVGVPLFDEAVAVVEGRPSLRETLAVGRRMQTALAPYARVDARVDAGLRIWRRISLAVRRRLGRVGGFRLAGGGAIVAIMGGDGAGKSTVIEEVGRWLSRDFAVTRVHLGKPPWSLTTYVVRGALKLATKLGLGRDVIEDVSGPGGTELEMRRLFWYACKARDRYREYRKARRTANRGVIVLSDRFPHPALRETDVPQIARLIDGSPGPLFEMLIRLEHRYHSLVALPDLAFVLRLDPEEAARRKTDEPYQYVLERSTEIWDTDWSGYDVHVIDAGRPPEAVAAEIKEIIWEALT